MGLNCSHDAFDGAYSAFNRFRKYVAKCAGGSYPPHGPDAPVGILQNHWSFDDDIVPPRYTHGLTVFMAHSDCDGIIIPEDCAKVADALEWLMLNHGEDVECNGHLTCFGNMKAVTLQFATGCRNAALVEEVLTFG